MSYKAGFIGVIGLPNSGKSTLLNKLVGEKVSIVTAKPQTTRRRVMGVVSEEDYQIVFVDAPGIVSASSGLNKFLEEEAHDVISQSDALLVVLNIDEDKMERLEQVIALAKESKRPWLAFINKTDLPLIHRPQIVRDLLTPLNVPIMQGSALKETEELKQSMLEQLLPMVPESKGPMYDKELYTLSTTRDLASEILREKCFENLHQEVPFGLAVKILRYDEENSDVVMLHSEIVVAKENHRPIVIGREGSGIKKIGTEARKEIEKLIGRKVYLDLKVTSKRNWQKNPGFMKELGYVVD
jgi:GTP-binding protein Era